MQRILVTLALLATLVVSGSAQNLTGQPTDGRDDFRYGEGLARGGSLTVRDVSDLGPVAGDGLPEIELGADPRTRREAIVDMLRDLFLGYVERDISRFYKALAPDALFGAGIARNAVLEDFKRLENVNVDIEVTEYRYTLNTTCVRFRWRRVATEVETGQPNVLDGVSQFCGDRSTGFQFQRIVGVPPFGHSYPEFLQQVQAGQPGTSPTLAGTVLALGLAVSESATIDFDTGTLEKWTGEPVVGPGVDVVIFRPAAECEGGCLAIGLRAGVAMHGLNVDGDFVLNTENGAGLQPCVATTPGFGEVGAVGPDSSLGGFAIINPSVQPHLGVRTDQGRFAVVAWDLPASLEFEIADDRQVLPTVPEVCNTEPPPPVR